MATLTRGFAPKPSDITPSGFSSLCDFILGLRSMPELHYVRESYLATESQSNKLIRPPVLFINRKNLRKFISVTL